MGEYRGSCGVQLSSDVDSGIDPRVSQSKSVVEVHRSFIPSLIGIKLIK